MEYVLIQDVIVYIEVRISFLMNTILWKGVQIINWDMDNENKIVSNQY